MVKNKISIDLDQLRERIEQLTQECKSISGSFPVSGSIQSLDFLNSLLDDFSINETVTGEYFVVISGGFSLSIRRLENLLPMVKSESKMHALIEEICAVLSQIILSIASIC